MATKKLTAKQIAARKLAVKKAVSQRNAIERDVGVFRDVPAGVRRADPRNPLSGGSPLREFSQVHQDTQKVGSGRAEGLTRTMRALPPVPPVNVLAVHDVRPVGALDGTISLGRDDSSLQPATTAINVLATRLSSPDLFIPQGYVFVLREIEVAFRMATSSESGFRFFGYLRLNGNTQPHSLDVYSIGRTLPVAGPPPALPTFFTLRQPAFRVLDQNHAISYTVWTEDATGLPASTFIPFFHGTFIPRRDAVGLIDQIASEPLRVKAIAPRKRQVMAAKKPAAKKR